MAHSPGHMMSVEFPVKKIVLAVLVAGGLFAGYRSYTLWRAVSVYEKFATAWTHGEKAEAAQFGEPDAVKDALERQSLRGMPSGAIMEAFRGERYAIESKTRLPGGDLRIEARQTIFFDPPGATTGIGGAMYTHIHHSVTLRGNGTRWKVVAFKAAYMDMRETRRRS
jgi:hypothetical protein